MMKKAQGLSINTIIIAAIALLVLVILSVMLIGRLGIFSTRVSEIGRECSAYSYVNAEEDWQGANARWYTACPADEGEVTYREIYGVTDATEHPTEKCCAPFISGAGLKTA